MRTIPQDLIRAHVYCVHYLVFLDEAERKRYCYVAVRQEDMPKLHKALEAGHFELEDVGMVLEEGMGEAPAHIQEKMRYLYQCDHASGAVHTALTTQPL